MTSADVCPPARSRGRCTRAPLVAALLLLFAAASAAEDPAPAPPLTITQESVIADLNAALQWFGDVRVTLRAVRSAAGVTLAGTEEQVARQALDRAFAAARAKSALVDEPPDRPAASPRQQAIHKRNDGGSQGCIRRRGNRREPAATR